MSQANSQANIQANSQANSQASQGSTPIPNNGKSVTIVGAGLAGSLLACYLADAGWNVSVFERRPDPRAKGYLGGRSINLALSIRGLLGLAGAGLDEHVSRRDAIRMPGRMIHLITGSPVFQPYSSNPADAINSVSRGGLNLTLINAAASRPNVDLFFDSPCVHADLATATATFSRPDSITFKQSANLLVGTDGAFSAVRSAFLITDRFNFQQSYLEQGYKELYIPPANRIVLPHNALTPSASQDGSLDPAAFALDPYALHIWPRGAAMMIALPNRDGSFTCTLFWPFQGEHSFQSLEGTHLNTNPDPQEIEAFFDSHYPDAASLMPTLAQDFIKNPTSSLVTVRCSPWQRHGKSCLLGDAAHAIVPFYGQGMNAAFEDCLVLAQMLAQHADQRDALEAYADAREPNANAIADMALENFIEMRDLAGKADFQYRKKIEQTLHRELASTIGERTTPQYNLVSFSTVPYWMAQRRGKEMLTLLTHVAQAVPAPAIPSPSLPSSSLSINSSSDWTQAIISAALPLYNSITPIQSNAALSHT